MKKAAVRGGWLPFLLTFFVYYDILESEEGRCGVSFWGSAGQSVLLMDSESNAFYIKSTDPSGMPLPLRIFDYTERTAQSAQTSPQSAAIDASMFVTHEELEARIAQISAPTTAKRTAAKKTAEVEDGK